MQHLKKYTFLNGALVSKIVLEKINCPREYHKNPKWRGCITHIFLWTFRSPEVLKAYCKVFSSIEKQVWNLVTIIQEKVLQTSKQLLVIRLNYSCNMWVLNARKTAVSIYACMNICSFVLIFVGLRSVCVSF